MAPLLVWALSMAAISDAGGRRAEQRSSCSASWCSAVCAPTIQPVRVTRMMSSGASENAQ